MKIFTSEVIKSLDEATCKAQKISSIDLMERAAQAVAAEIMRRFYPSQRIVVIAGPGNNGGDALAVARLLIEQGYADVEIYLFNVSGRLSHDCSKESERLKALEGVNFTVVEREFAPPVLGKTDVVLDGLFGSGLRTPLQGGFVTVARYINASGAFVISIDVPSGLFGEWNDKTIIRDMVHADLTLCFQQPRLSFFFPENAPAIGKVKTLDINLDREAMLSAHTDFIYVQERNAASMLQPHNDWGEKRDFGSALLFCGSVGMFGAAILCAHGVLRSGAGLATVHSAAYGLIPLQTAVPCAMFEADKNEAFISDMRLHHSHQAVAVGPGIGTAKDTIDALEALLKNVKCPLVADADALNCIARRPALLSLLPPKSVITPHSGEFDRLFGEHSCMELRLRTAIEKAKYYNIIIVLKGHHTLVVRPTGKVYINSTGNSGMATAGAGDVLTGVITSFLAQGYRPELAATLGVYVHGLAGDLAAAQIGQFGITAADIAENLGRAINSIMAAKNDNPASRNII